MAPGKTIFHYKQVIFHFHVSESEGNLYLTLFDTLMEDVSW